MSALGRRVNLREVAEDVSDVRARQAHEESRDLSRLLCRLGAIGVGPTSCCADSSNSIRFRAASDNAARAATCTGLPYRATVG